MSRNKWLFQLMSTKNTRRLPFCFGVAAWMFSMVVYGAVQVRSTALVVGQVVEADGNRPVSDTVVTISPTNVVSGAAGGQRFPTAVLTDSNGRFVFNGLPAAEYQILATKPGYIEGAYDRLTASGPAGRLALIEGERRADLRISIWKTASISGLLLDEQSEPIVGGSIQVLERTYVAGRRRFGFRAAALTDDRGAFRVPSLPPGTYVITAPSTQVTLPRTVLDSYVDGTLAPDLRQQLAIVRPLLGPVDSQNNQKVGDVIWQLQGRGPTPPPTTGATFFVYPTTYYPAATLLQDAQLIPLRSGEERSGVVIQLNPRPAAKISGVVQSDDGPAANTAIRLLPAGATDLVSDSGFEVATSITDGNGQFTLVGIPSGTYVIQASKSQYTVVPATPGNLIQVTPNRTATGAIQATPRRVLSTRWARETVVVDATDLAGIAVRLQDGIGIKGRVQFDGLTTPGEISMLLKNLVITVEAADGLRRTMPTSSPNPDGSFVLGVEPGTYFIRIRNPPQGWTLRGSMVRNMDASDRPLVLSSEDVTGITVVLTNKPTSVSGTVYSSSGAEDSRAMVAAFPVDKSYWIDFGLMPRRLQMTRTDSSGKFSILGLPSGTYFIASYPADAQWTDIEEMFSELSKAASRIEITDEHPTVVRLTTIQRRQ